MEFNTFPRDDGPETTPDGAETSTPGDAESTALVPDVHKVSAPAEDMRDHEALREPHERLRAEADHQQHAVHPGAERAAHGAGDLEMHSTREATDVAQLDDTAGDAAAEVIDETRPVQGRVVETVPEAQQQFWTGLAQASEQAGRAAHVRNNAPNTDDALEQDYHQHQLFGAVQAYNEAGAQSLFGVARAQVAEAQAARREAEASGAQEPELTDVTETGSEDGSVRIVGRQLVDEEAQILLSDGSRASFAIPEEQQTEGSSVFFVTTRQTVAQHVVDGAEAADPITLDVTNEFVVHGSDPGVAHWTNLTMDTVRDGASDDDHFDQLTGRVLNPMVANGVPDEPEGTDPSMQNSFFRTLDAIGINSAVTQVGSTELAGEASDTSDREQKLFEALDQAGYPVERSDTQTVEEQPETGDTITEAQAKVVSEVAMALHYFDYDSSDQDTVESMTNALANFSQVAAQNGDWETVATCRERLNEMEENEFSQFSATARVLLHQQELGLDIQAAEDLRTRLEAEKQQQSVQPMLDTVIEECQALGISPEPWIEKYAADAEDVFRRTMDHYAYIREPGLDDAVDTRLSTMATSLIEDTSLSPEFVCEMVPTAMGSVDDRHLQERLMGRYLEALEDADMSPQEYGRLIEMGVHSIRGLENAFTRQAAALDTTDDGAFAQAQHEAQLGRQLVEGYDEAISHAIVQLGSQGQLTYESAMTQMYWAQEVTQFGIEPNAGVPNFTIDGMIKEITERMDSLPKQDGEGGEKPSRMSVVNYRDTIFDHLAGIAVRNGAFGDCRKLINAMAPMNQARAYVNYWGQAQTYRQLDSLDPALNVAPELRPFEADYNGRLAGLRTHYDLSRYLIEDESAERGTSSSAETDPGRRDTAQTNHNLRMNRQGHAVGRSLARLLPRAGDPPKPKSPHIPLFRTQLDQIIDRLGDNAPDLQADLARGLLQDQTVRDAGDKELTFKLASILARTGDPDDYKAGIESMVGIRGGLKDQERRHYKLQLAEAYSESLAA